MIYLTLNPHTLQLEMQDKPAPYVYKLTHKITGQFYFGYRKENVKLKRLAKDDLGKFYFTSSKIIKEIGFKNFYYEILGEYEKWEEAYIIEQQKIKEHWRNILLINGFYHDIVGGKKYFCNNKPHNEETKKLMSKNHFDITGIKNPNFGKFGEKNHLWGTKRKPSTIEKMKLASKKGKDNPTYDKTIFLWKHKSNIEEKCTGYELRMKYNLDKNGISDLKSGRLKTHSKWSLIKKL